MKALRWADLTWEEIDELLRSGAVPLLPVGSVEQHGPHLPVGTDFYVAEAVAKLAAEKLLEEGLKALVMPPLPYGLSSMWAAYPGTVTLSAEPFISSVRDILKSLLKDGGKVVVVNGHAGNSDALRVAGREVVEEVGQGEVAVVSVWDLCGELINKVFQTKFFHADEVETSVMLAIEGRIKNGVGAGNPIFRKYGKWHSLDLTVRPKAYVYRSESRERHGSGSFGRPDLASREKGVKLLECMSAELAEFVKDFMKGET